MASGSRPTSRGFGPGSSTPRHKVHNGFVCPLVGAPKPLPLSCATAYPASAKSKSTPLQTALGNVAKNDIDRPRSQGSRRNNSASVHYRDGRPRTQGSSRRADLAENTIDGASPTYANVLDFDAWVACGKEIANLAKTLDHPSALLTARACDAAFHLAPASLPQHPVISALMTHIEASVYCTDDVRFFAHPAQSPTVAGAVLRAVPRRYVDRVPYFVVVRRQEAFLASMRQDYAHLAKIIKQSTNLKQMAPQLCAMTWVGIKKAACVWLFAFWRLFCIEQRRIARKKADLLAQSVVVDCLQPFMYWRMYVVEQSTALLEQTRDCFKLEGKMLSVQVKDLELQRMDVRQKLRDSCENTQRLKERLDAEVREREALAGRLESTHPELVRKMLCSVMNVVMGVVLRDAKLNKVITRRSLATKELSVLLMHDEESVQKLITVPGESILLRWVNYHLMQGRLVATEIFESIARARSEETNPTGTVTEWSSRDADAFSDRCREVRGLHRISDLSSDLSEGKVLSVVYASLASAIHGQGTLNPAALWPLDERDAEVRASKLCEAIRLILPTRTAQYLLKHSDVSKGNSSVLAVVLATLFLHNSALPNSSPDSEVFTYITAAAQKITSGVDIEANPSSDAGSDGLHSHSPDEEPRQSDSDSEEREVLEQKDDAKAVKQDETLKHILSVAEQTASSCAYDSLQDLEMILKGGEVCSDLLRMPLVDLLLRWLNLKLEKDGKSKVASLSELKGGKILHELLRRVAHDVIAVLPESQDLPETSKQRAGKEGVPPTVERYSSNYSSQDAQENTVDRRAARMQIVLDCASRCTSFDILTKEAVSDGQSDVIAAFLASLFLSRPSLPISARSSLRKHMDHIEECVRQGAASQKPEVGKDAGSGFANLCTWLKDKWKSMDEAMLAVHKALDLQAAVEQRLYGFIGNLLARRARGVPWKLADEEEVHDTKKLALLPSSRLGAVIMRETHQLTGSAFKDNVNLVDDLLRKHARLFRELFLHYALPFRGEAVACSKSSSHRRKSVTSTMLSMSFGMDGNSGVSADQDYESSTFDLQGAMRIYKDCRLRTPKFLPRDVEDIFNEVKAEAEAEAQAAEAERATKVGEEATTTTSTKSSRNRKIDKQADKDSGRASPKVPLVKQKPHQAGLTLEDFIEVMILMGCRSQTTVSGFAEQFQTFIERRLWPYACRQNDDFFYKMSHDIGVRMTFLKHDKALRSVFTTYASSASVGDSIREGKQSQQQNIWRSSTPAAAKLPRLLHVDRFEAMLNHAGMVRGRMTGSALRTILAGVESFTQESESEAESDDSDSDQSEKNLKEAKYVGDGMISYPEFTSALIAVVLHLDPNPFTAFSTRFDRFIRDKFLKALKTYWQENSLDAGLGKTLEYLLSDNQQNKSPRDGGRPTKNNAGATQSEKTEKSATRASEIGKKSGRTPRGEAP